MNKENTFLAYPSESEEKCKFYVYMDENNRLYYLNKEYEKKLEDKNQEINRLNNIINELDDEIYSLYEDICNSDDTYSYRIPIEIIIDRLFKMTSKIAKFKENEELKDSD